MKTKLLWDNPEYRKHMSDVHVGQIAWNKGKKTGIIPKSAFKKGQIGTRRGKKNSEEHRRKASIARKGKPSFKTRGENHHWWKGGITPVRASIMNSLEYKLWRESVFKRDDWTCVWCLKRGGKLNADHIKPFALFPELRFAIDNGRTLCVECHRKTDTYGGRTK